MFRYTLKELFCWTAFLGLAVAICAKLDFPAWLTVAVAIWLMTTIAATKAFGTIVGFVTCVIGSCTVSAVTAATMIRHVIVYPPGPARGDNTLAAGLVIGFVIGYIAGGFVVGITKLIPMLTNYDRTSAKTKTD